MTELGKLQLQWAEQHRERLVLELIDLKRRQIEAKAKLRELDRLVAELADG